MFSPLELAVKQSNLETVKVLIEFALKTDNTKKWDEGLLSRACESNSVDVVAYLISKIKNGTKIIDVLLQKGAKIDAKMDGYGDLNGYTPIDIAVAEQNVENAKFIASKGAGTYSENTFRLSLINQNVELVKFFVNKGYDVNKKDKTTHTPLHYVSGFPNGKISVEIIKLLLAKGAKVRVYDFEPYSFSGPYRI